MRKLLLVIIVNLALVEILSGLLIFIIGNVKPEWHLEARIENHFAGVDPAYFTKALNRNRDSILGWNTRDGDTQKEKNLAGNIWTATVGSDGSRVDDAEHNEVLVATYGDSFTFCAEVNNNETWQFFLEEKVGRDVKNYGVSAFGVGQIWLKMQRDFEQKKVEKITIFGIYEGDLARAVNGFRPFLNVDTGVVLGFKPSYRYLDGEIKFIPNPWDKSIRTLQQLKELAIRSSRDDYYASSDKIIRSEFPYTLQALRAVNIIIQKLRLKYGLKNSESIWETNEGEAVMDHILESFVEAATKNGSIPVVLFIPNLQDKVLDSWNEPEYISYKNRIRKNTSNSLVVLDVFEAKFDEDKFNVVPYKGHASKYGNQVIAEYLYEQLNALHLIPEI